MKSLESKAKVRDLVVERESKLSLNMQPQKKSQTIVEEPDPNWIYEKFSKCHDSIKSG